MIKRIITAICGFVAIALLSCCSNVLPEQAGQDDVVAGQDAVTFTCVIASDPDSRVSISEQGKTTWEPGDQILLHGDYTREGYGFPIVTLSDSDISADGKRATFSVSGVTRSTHSATKGYLSTIYAGYPASAVKTGEHCYYYTNFEDTNHPLMAAFNVGNTLYFYNLCGVISFKVSGNFDTYEFEGNNFETVGYSYFRSYLVQKSDGSYRLDYNYTSDGGTNGPLTMISGPVTPDGSTIHYIGLPAGANLTGGFTIRFYKNGSLVKVAKTNTAVNVARNKYLALGNITSRLEDPSAGEEHQSAIDLDSATDLGASETANCYIVTSPGNYKFKAVQGNSSTSVGNVAGVQLVWETCGNATAPARNSVISAVDFEGKWICFSTPSTLKPGNALIAAKNSDGKIIWSWHIWIPSTSINADTYKFATHRLMDRNLGALEATSESGTAAPESFGLLYQWGRKDPFVGAGALNSTTQAGTAGTAVSTSGQMTLAESVAGPTVFASPASGADWCSATNADYWGDTSGSKSIYDPCPEGYKVPRREDVPALFNTDLNGATNFNYNSTLGRYTVGNPVMVVPLCGYRETSGGLTHVFDRSILWNSHHDGSYTYAGYSQYMYYDNGVQSKTWSQSKARAGSVRCMSEEEVPFENAPGMPVQGNYTKYVFGSNVEELSGLCFSKDRDFIWGVGDEGAIYRISLDFKTVTQVLATGSDLEDVTIHPDTGDLYFAKEPNRIDKMAAPGYSAKTQLFNIPDAPADGSNDGLEGIAYYKDNIIYAGAQRGANLWKYNLDGTLIWKKALGTVAPQIQEVGGLCYDAEKDWLWVTDSEARKLFVFNGEVTELLAIYDVSYIGNNESVLVDRPNGVVYVGDDGTSSKIYTIKFTNL